MTEYLGIDGFRGGWVAAWIDDRGSHGFDYSPSLHRLLPGRYRRAMIDTPIGLTTKGHRTCDFRARELVGAAVFLGARRNLWIADGDQLLRYESAYLERGWLGTEMCQGHWASTGESMTTTGALALPRGNQRWGNETMNSILGAHSD